MYSIKQKYVFTLHSYILWIKIVHFSNNAAENSFTAFKISTCFNCCYRGIMYEYTRVGWFLTIQTVSAYRTGGDFRISVKKWTLIYREKIKWSSYKPCNFQTRRTKGRFRPKTGFWILQHIGTSHEDILTRFLILSVYYNGQPIDL